MLRNRCNSVSAQNNIIRIQWFIIELKCYTSITGIYSQWRNTLKTCPKMYNEKEMFELIIQINSGSNTIDANLSDKGYDPYPLLYKL